MTSRRSLHLTTLLVSVLCLSFSSQGLAVDCSLPETQLGTSSGDAFNITTTSFTSAEIQTAASYWSSCSGYGSEMPTFQAGGSGGIPVTIMKVVGNSTDPSGACGVTSITPRNQTGRERMTETPASHLPT
jgi:hypothetical protein